MSYTGERYSYYVLKYFCNMKPFQVPGQLSMPELEKPPINKFC